MSKSSQTITLTKRQGYDLGAHVRRILNDTFVRTTWTKLKFTGSKKYTLVATGSEDSTLTIEFYAEPTLDDRAGTAADVGSRFGRSPSAPTLFAELRDPNGKREFDVVT